MADLVLKHLFIYRHPGFRLISTKQEYSLLADANEAGAVSLAGPDSPVFTVNKPAGRQGAAGCPGADAHTHS
jgi:hypothetical protein